MDRSIDLAVQPMYLKVSRSISMYLKSIWKNLEAHQLIKIPKSQSRLKVCKSTTKEETQSTQKVGISSSKGRFPVPFWMNFRKTSERGRRRGVVFSDPKILLQILVFQKWKFEEKNVSINFNIDVYEQFSFQK